jgi:ATP-dependent Zn protease
MAGIFAPSEHCLAICYPLPQDAVLELFAQQKETVETAHACCSEHQARGDVVVIGATNRPDLVDAALLRPGRFDSRLYVPPPKDASERASILGVLTRGKPLDSDVDLAALADLSPGYAYAFQTHILDPKTSKLYSGI